MVSKYKILLLVISILILAAIVLYADPYTVFLTLSKADFLFVLFAFIISNIAICIQVLKWNILLKGINFKELFPIQLLGITISNFTPGKASEPIKAILLKLKKGTPVSETLPSIIWERIMDITVIVILALFAIQILTQAEILFLSIASIAVLIILICLLFLILYNKKFGLRVFKILVKFPILNRLTIKFLETFYKSKIKNSKLLFSFILSVLTWLLYGFVFYFSLLALGINLSPLLLSGILALSIIIGVLSSLPGGIGSTDVVMVLLLSLVGVENIIAVSSVLIARFLSLWYGIFLGGLSFIYLGKKIKMKDIFK